MPLTDVELEELEKRYFEELAELFTSEKDHILERIQSMSNIREDWYRRGFIKKTNTFDCGVERVFHSILNREKEWEVNSTPIGSDVCFETDDCMLHIELKTVLKSDSDVSLNRVVVRHNQTSYDGKYPIKGKKGKRKGKEGRFQPNLPTYYTHSEMGELPTLTYFIKIVYTEDWELESITLHSIPNGQLTDVYGEIFDPPKTWPKTTRILDTVRVRMNDVEEPKLTDGWRRSLTFVSRT